jgi:phosphatidylinositol glycan class B
MNRKIVIIAILVHLLTAIFSVGYYHVDEHFQILEFTALKSGMAQEGDLAWEYQDRLRPAIQPAIAYSLVHISNLIHLNNPFWQAMALRIISALLSLLCMYLLILSFDKEIRSAFLKNWLVFLSFLIWFLPYIHVRYSSENWAGLTFWSGFALLQFTHTKYRISDEFHLKEFIIGIILGLSFIIRFQAGLLIGGLILWLIFIKKEKYSKLLVIIFGILFSILIGVLVDYWFYGEWTLTAWNYFKINILENNVPNFGIEPWWYYFEEVFIKAFPPFSILIIIGPIFIWFYFPKHALTWVTLPFLTVHFLFGHKELRFLFPLINILPVILILSIQVLKEDSRFYKLKNLANTWRKPLILLFLIVNSILLLILCFKPADMHIYLYQYIYNNYDAENTEVLYIERNPYSRAVPLNFYKKKDLEVIQINHSDEIINHISDTGGKTILFATRKFKTGFDSTTVKCFPVYRTLPSVVRYVNVNNWIERTPMWTLYECTPTK